MANVLQLTAEQELVLSWLEDDESRMIYQTLCEYHVNHDPVALSEMEFSVFHKRSGLDLFASLQACESVVLFGAGSYGWGTLNTFSAQQLPVVCFCDNDPQKYAEKFCGLPVLSPDAVREQYPTATIVVAVTSQHNAQEIYAQLISLGYPKEQIVIVIDGFGVQYLDCDALSFGAEEVMVDAGCFDGADILNFIKKCNGDYSKVFAFEPNEKNFSVCQAMLKQHPNCNIYPYGLWNQKETLYFAESGASSCVCASGTQTVEVTSLDEILPQGERVTYIKMDIEGAEMNALRGAARTIQESRPKLAICIYHKPVDLTEIPLYIRQLVPDYRFMIRHYGFGALETVLYAY